MDEKWPEAGTVSVAEPFRSSQPIAACLRDTENWVQRRYSAPHRLSACPPNPEITLHCAKDTTGQEREMTSLTKICGGR